MMHFITWARRLLRVISLSISDLFINAKKHLIARVAAGAGKLRALTGHKGGSVSHGWRFVAYMTRLPAPVVGAGLQQHARLSASLTGVYI